MLRVTILPKHLVFEDGSPRLFGDQFTCPLSAAIAEQWPELTPLHTTLFTVQTLGENPKTFVFSAINWNNMMYNKMRAGEVDKVELELFLFHELFEY